KLGGLAHAVLDRADVDVAALRDRGLVAAQLDVGAQRVEDLPTAAVTVVDRDWAEPVDHERRHLPGVGGVEEEPQRPQRVVRDRLVGSGSAGQAERRTRLLERHGEVTPGRTESGGRRNTRL